MRYSDTGGSQSPRVYHADGSVATGYNYQMAQNSPTVDIVVLNWNGAEDTTRCIESLERQTFPYRNVVVVDNGSTGDSLAILGRLHDRRRIRLVLLPKNLGYTGGNNLAMARSFEAGADFVWLFNNDAVAEADTLEELIAVAQSDHHIGLISPLIREAENAEMVQFACGLFDPLELDYRPSTDPEIAAGWLRQAPDRVILYGTALLVSKEVFHAIGGFDSRLFAYWEDVDYSIRSARAGFRNVAVLGTSAFHERKLTRRKPETVKPHYYYYYTRNEILVWRRVGTGKFLLRTLFRAFVRQYRQVQRMPNYEAGVRAIYAGLWDGWLGRGGSYDPARHMPLPARLIVSAAGKIWGLPMVVSGDTSL